MELVFSDPEAVMRRAVELAEQGRGFVEPNPCVGAVIVDDSLGRLGEGWHQQFGGPHAEIHALRNAGARARGAILYCTLEPCCHTGKTGPCTEAIIAAGVRKVVIGIRDPAPHVAGGGIAALRAAGIEVEVGVLSPAALRLAAPFVQRVTTGRPWVHAKWAMTLDGKIAARTGHSQWISGERSRAAVHRLRGRMDAILVGAGTARTDDPRLTPRPAGPRTPVRIVVDAQAALSLESNLVRTARDVPVLVAALESAPAENVDRLGSAGVEVLTLPAEADASGPSARVDLRVLLEELGRRQMSNILVEGGGRLLGSLFDRELIDEAHVFIAPKLLGGAEAPGPLAGRGLAEVPPVPSLAAPDVQTLDGDVYVRGLLATSVARLENCRNVGRE